ncbi:MAG: tRNA (adenosine(37)-N6)-threonylcarbamoyltransferase complex ATPase subunit type 1 TsaE [Planctomycetes bacterium]|nr:tRNA (adenosine(37)-N6)-threonylcarbamoyltransferase complex ATPase subunit type 1 TsaE [Planctomycetota bacterium]
MAIDSPGITFSSVRPEHTQQIGRWLADVLEPGAVVAIRGELAAGKTVLVRAIAEALGADSEEVASPTFVLVREYAGRLPIYHADAYRLKGPDEFIDLGGDEYLFGDGVCLIEWADRVASILPDDRLEVQIEITGEQSRRIRIIATGSRSARILDRLRGRRTCS